MARIASSPNWGLPRRQRTSAATPKNMIGGADLRADCHAADEQGRRLAATGFSVLVDFATGDSSLNGVMVVNRGIKIILKADVKLSANTKTSSLLTGIGLVALTTELSMVTQNAAVANDVGRFPNWFNDYHTYISWP